MSDEHMLGAEPVERGCGTRTKGGVYAEMGLSQYGRPIEDFLWCPPVPINIAEYGLTPINVKLIQRGEDWHILDWIGLSNYPWPTDYIEEIRRFGLSAKMELASAEEYEKLTSASRILPVHSRAYIVNPNTFWQDRFIRDTYDWRLCPKELPDHEAGEEILAKIANDLTYTAPTCLGLCYENVADATVAEGQTRCGTKRMPSFTYECALPPSGAETLYTTAIFAAWHITRLVVVRDPDSSMHEIKLKNLTHVHLPVDLVEE